MEKQLPEKYEQKKIDLTPLGASGFAWKKEDLIQFLNDKDTLNFAILGGDVLSLTRINHKTLCKYTYDNWSVSIRPIDESFEIFCQRTRAETLDYITRYPDSNDTIFAPVITSESTAGWLS